MKASGWVTLVLVLVVLVAFNLTSVMWGTGINDYSPRYFLEQTVFTLRDWTAWIGFILAALLLFLERQGSPIGKYWIIYPIFRLLYDVGWMVYAGNPYPSWYAQDFGAFLISMSLALVIDYFGTKDIEVKGPKVDTESQVKLWISGISLITALLGLLKTLLSK